jgi:hypothetical protein
MNAANNAVGAAIKRRQVERQRIELALALARFLGAGRKVSHTQNGVAPSDPPVASPPLLLAPSVRAPEK